MVLGSVDLVACLLVRLLRCLGALSLSLSGMGELGTFGFKHAAKAVWWLCSWLHTNVGQTLFQDDLAPVCALQLLVLRASARSQCYDGQGFEG
ncbi:hypothetical protein PF001_g30731 [Phytophthora fragariae]|uniref:Secreted protein n=1 Tax=Phytophthora fragariae TaxID=53985 RepID=A0A6A4B5Q6_9STRA|nr:hypothetical protein PF006_g31720 [Phytophthora fragariae]KAE9265817.1 hypothetical protein PF001_g30731 [Phytophthora fragariae]